MKWLDFAIKVTSYVLAIVTARFIGEVIPGWTFESALLSFILWQLILESRKEAK